MLQNKLVLLVLLVILSSCGKKETFFELQGLADAHISEEVTLVLLDGETEVEWGKVVPAEGRFVFQGELKEAKPFLLLLGNREYELFLEPSKIEVKLEEEELLVKGSKAHRLFADYYKMKKELNEQYLRLELEAEENPVLNMQELEAKEQELVDEFEQKSQAFLMKNIASPVVPYLFYSEYEVMEKESAELEEIKRKIKQKHQENPFSLLLK